jgi:hypothetical protein
MDCTYLLLVDLLDYKVIVRMHHEAYCLRVWQNSILEVCAGANPREGIRE